MPIKINYLDDGDGIEFILSGVLRGRDIIDTHLKTHSTETVARLKYKIVDKSRVTENYISHDDISKIARLDIAVAEINPRLITAIVSPSELVHKVTDVWKERVASHYDFLQTFMDRTEADRWIKQMLAQQSCS